MRKKYMKLTAVVLLVFLCSTAVFYRIDPADALTAAWLDEKELGTMCIEQVVPEVKKIKDSNKTEEKIADNSDNENLIDSEQENAKQEKKQSDDKTSKKKVTGDPLVIIYHTHASESYMPYKESNYHREAEEGTVRDVGDVLESELEKKGINVIHDKTIHDRPSYNELYNKSLATIEGLINKYPSAIYIIDLHRDAALASASEGKYIEINGKRIAKFSMVVGQANDNYVELYDFAEKIREKAGNMYDGFGGAIIERNYNYNEYLTDRCLLLEIGNNKNTIEEARLCGRYFGRVLAEIIQEEQ